ncbi:S49 family peptidase [Natronomonas sp.]|uniref:S49 family peptidase n=1 Tax=Natronomonas sp. TaxID=2184060 RepID=UPI00261E89FB|nr:S49 family peptidase [Natronomonas sp.]
MSSNRLTAAVDAADAFLRRLGRSYVLVVVVALVVGSLLAPVVFFGVASDPAQVAVVPIAGTIDGPNEQRVGQQLERAQEDPNVEAVVLVINSGGGSAAASEELYLEVKRTAEVMPVVTAVDAGALSGAYYAAAPSDEMYAKPASAVGSVGVITTAPSDLEPNDIVLTTGPSKTAPDDLREFAYQRQEISNAFANAVLEHRGSDMEITRGELTEANTYTGTTANELGLVDRIGGRERAVARAAELAELDEYAVTVLRGEGTVRFISQANYVAADSPQKETVSPSYLTGQRTEASGAINHLAIPAEYAVSEAARPNPNPNPSANSADPPDEGAGGDRTEATADE